MALFDFDTDAPAADPWDFTVRVGGVDHATREPTLFEIADLQAKLAGDTATVLTGVAAFLRRLFVGEPPDESAFTAVRAVALMKAVLDVVGPRMNTAGGPATGQPAAGEAAARRVLPN